MSSKYSENLISIVKSQNWLMSSLKAIRVQELPDWYVAAGAIRNTVWNILHGYSGDKFLKDIDVAYFNSEDLNEEKDRDIERRLLRLCNGLPFEVINQARAHIFNGRKQANSSCDSISFWSETPNCVGVRLERDDSLTICAPYGLEDLFELRVRPIPLPKRDLELYTKRMKSKQWDKCWQNLKITYE